MDSYIDVITLTNYEVDHKDFVNGTATMIYGNLSYNRAREFSSNVHSLYSSAFVFHSNT